jgi:[ribosomal protein S18]-alanine N-acetyltransferase
MKVTYRKAQPRDFLKLAEVDRVSWLDNKNSEYIPDGEHAWRLWCEYSTVFCCILNGEAIGGSLAFKADNENVFAIHKIFVLKKYRNKGYGYELMKLTLNEIQNYNCSAFLTVDPANENAIKLYEKMGFHRHHLVKGYYRDNEDRYIMMIDPTEEKKSNETD